MKYVYVWLRPKGQYGVAYLSNILNGCAFDAAFTASLTAEEVGQLMGGN